MPAGEQFMQPMQAVLRAELMRTDARQAMKGRESAGHLQARTSAPRAVVDQMQNDAVVELAGALRSADRAYRAYLAELDQGDVEPAEDWSTWYAEFLLGLG